MIVETEYGKITAKHETIQQIMNLCTASQLWDDTQIEKYGKEGNTELEHAFRVTYGITEKVWNQLFDALHPHFGEEEE